MKKYGLMDTPLPSWAKACRKGGPET
jgi:hypothetical protein